MSLQLNNRCPAPPSYLYCHAHGCSHPGADGLDIPQCLSAKSCNVPAFVALVSAYEVLRSPKRRLQYDDVSRRHGGAMANQLASRGGTASPARAHHQDVVDAAEAEADRWLQWLYHVV